jgi:hypothetical protein
MLANLAYDSITKEPILVEFISEKFVAERLSSVYSAEAKSWQLKV